MQSNGKQIDGEDLRRAIFAEVEAIEPHDAREGEQREQVLAWIRSGEELFRRAKPATPPMHLVSYFVVTDGEHLLLVDHRNAERWLPTGGHVEPGEHPRATVVREALEELGIEARFFRTTPLFVSVTETARWFAYDEAPFERSDPDLPRFLAKLKRELAQEEAGP